MRGDCRAYEAIQFYCGRSVPKSIALITARRSLSYLYPGLDYFHPEVSFVSCVHLRAGPPLALYPETGPYFSAAFKFNYPDYFSLLTKKALDSYPHRLLMTFTFGIAIASLSFFPVFTVDNTL